MNHDLLLGLYAGISLAVIYSLFINASIEEAKTFFDEHSALIHCRSIKLHDHAVDIRSRNMASIMVTVFAVALTTTLMFNNDITYSYCAIVAVCGFVLMKTLFNKKVSRPRDNYTDADMVRIYKYYLRNSGQQRFQSDFHHIA